MIAEGQYFFQREAPRWAVRCRDAAIFSANVIEEDPLSIVMNKARANGSMKSVEIFPGYSQHIFEVRVGDLASRQAQAFDGNRGTTASLVSLFIGG